MALSEQGAIGRQQDSGQQGVRNRLREGLRRPDTSRHLAAVSPERMLQRSIEADLGLRVIRW